MGVFLLVISMRLDEADVWLRFNRLGFMKHHLVTEEAGGGGVTFFYISTLTALGADEMQAG